MSEKLENKIQNQILEVENMEIRASNEKEQEKNKEKVKLLKGNNNDNEEKDDSNKDTININENKKTKHIIIKIILITIGSISFILGSIGIVLPILPTFPFYLLTLICFAKSSDRLHQWFINSKFYKNNLEDFVKGRGMTIKMKIQTILCLTLFMGIGFIMMKKTIVGRIILAIVWIFHIILFVLIVKTRRPDDNDKVEEKQEKEQDQEQKQENEVNNKECYRIDIENIDNENKKN